jgi:WD40 repeat protein/DNA-binding SARP family transcriptional activator
MTIRLLGPARIDGYGPALRRRDAIVLGALCVTPGAPVPVEVLADALWGDEVPKSGSKVVQGAVMRLRKLLGADTIETTPAGYRLRVSDCELDTSEFERLVARGRSFAAARDPHRAATTFQQALAMWRGAPFTELPDWDPARAAASRLLEVRRAVEEERADAVLASGRASEAAAECGVLVAREPYRENRWRLLAEALYRTGQQREALAALGQARATLREELGLDLGAELTDLERRILQQDPTLLDVPVRPPGNARLCPYQGLRPFDAGDADFFHGRDALIAEALGRLSEVPLLVVVGPSGSGKSSLVRAGLLPELSRRGRAVVVLAPGHDPCASLESAIASLADRSTVVVVDQLEEAFTATADPRRVVQFCERLAELAGSGTPIVLTVRADHFGGLAVSPSLSRLAERGLLLITPMTEPELRLAIEAPAAQVGLVLEAGLVDLLVRDVLGEPGGLPLLSHALAETWEHRDGAVLTVEGYAATGGIRGAVAQSAERLYESLSTPDRVALRSVLHRLVTPTPAGDPTVGHVPTRVFAGTPDAPRLLDLLVRARLVTMTTDTASIAHESLVRAWPRMRTWLDEDVEGQRVLVHLQIAADGWAALGRPADELYRGARLIAAQEWIDRASPVLAPLEAEFLAASQARENDERSERQRRLNTELRRNRQLRGALVVAAGLLAIALIAGSLALINGRKASRTATAADAGRLGALAAASGVSYDKALLYAVQALAIDDSPASESDLFATLLRGDAVAGAMRAPGAVTGLAFDPSNDRLWATTVNGHLLAWPAHGGPATTDTDLQRPIGAPALVSSDRVAVISDRGVTIVDAATGKEEARGPAADTVLWTLSPDRTIAISNVYGTAGERTPMIAVWRFATGEALTSVTLSAPPANIVGCGADTACVLTADAHLVRVRYEDGVVVSDAQFPLDTEPSIAASPDGSRVAIATPDGLLHIVDSSTGTVVQTLSGGTRKPAPLAFSPDGQQLAAADFEDVLVWRLDAHGLPQRYVGHSGRVMVAAWSPDGSSLATGATDQTVMRWDTVGDERLGRVVTDRLGGDTSTVWPTKHGVVVGQFGGRLLLVDPATGATTELRGASAQDIAVATARSAPTGDLLITADTDGTTTVWDLRTGRVEGTVDLPTPIMGRYSPDTWVSPDGTMAATLRDDTGIFVVDMATRRVVRHLPPLPDAATESAVVLGWTSDGSSLLVSRFDGPNDDAELLFVDATNGEVRLTVPMPGGVAYEATADPNGRFVAVVMSDGTLRVIDANDGDELAPPLQAAEGEAFNVSVSPDGAYISVSGWPPRVTLWDTRTFRRVGIPLPLDLDAREARARFGPDGQLAVTSGDVLRTFDIDPAHWLDRACKLTARQLTPAEYEEVLPGEPYKPGC